MPIEFDIASCTAAADENPEIELVPNLQTAAEPKGHDVFMLGGTGNFGKMSDNELDEQLVKYRTLKDSIKKNLKDTSRIEYHIDALETEKARRQTKARNAAIQSNAQDMANQQRRTYFDPPRSNGCSASLGISKDNKTDAPSPTGEEDEIRFRTYPRKKKQCTPETREAVERPKLALRRLQTIASRAIPVDKPRRRTPIGGTPDSAVVLFSSDDESPCTTAVREPSPKQESRTRRTSARLAEIRKLEHDLKIAYPSRDDPDAVEVYYRDLQRLNPTEFLNDTVIDFYIKYLQNTEVEDSDRFYFFNSFFFKKLNEAFDTEGKQKQVEALSKLRKWTKGINIFEKSYLFIPINDKLHWSLAIVCFAMPQEEGNNDKLIPFIYHLDSLESGHPSRSIFSCLHRYLETEHKHTQCSYHIDWEKLVTKRVEVPRQDNEYDCGLFLLCYIKRFVQKAPLPCKLTEKTNMFGRRWFRPTEASELRGSIQEVLIKMFEAMIP